jgi:hypothetical protein
MAMIASNFPDRPSQPNERAYASTWPWMSISASSSGTDASSETPPVVYA